MRKFISRNFNYFLQLGETIRFFWRSLPYGKLVRAHSLGRQKRANPFGEVRHPLGEKNNSKPATV